MLLVMFTAHRHVLCIFGGVNQASVLHAHLLEPVPEARLIKGAKVKGILNSP